MHREQSSGKRIGSRRGRQKASGVGSSKERRALLAQTVDLKEERREEKEVGDSLFLALNSVIFLENVLVFQGCCNKAPLTWWLTTRELYSVRILGTRGLKPKCWLHWFILKVVRKKLSHAILLPSAFSKSWCAFTCRCITLTSNSVFTWPSPRVSFCARVSLFL